LGDNCFQFFKNKLLIDQYTRFWSTRPDSRLENVFELGIWDGGSAAFWFECLRPKKLVAIDLLDREDSSYFKSYISSRGLQDRIRTYWRTNQADARALVKIAREESVIPLDLVFDDASHLYGPTKASFETLFPLLRPGGLYMIEDWAWAHYPTAAANFPPSEVELTKLVFELIELVGSAPNIASSVTVFPGFAAVERGSMPLQQSERWTIATNIVRRD
jgi:predicted O-methyltransferase YrrM